VSRRPDSAQYSIELLFKAVRLAMPEDVSVREICACTYSGGLRGRLRVLWQMWRASFGDTDVFHVTGDIHFAALVLPRRRTVLTIHDLTTLSSLRGWRRTVFLLLWIQMPVWRSAVVTVVSDAVRRELVSLLPRARGKVLVIPNCIVNSFPASTRVFNENCPTILLIGTAWNKNLPRVVRALQGLTCKVRIVGRVSPELHSVCVSSGVEYTSVHDLGDEAVRREYESCDMLVFASTHEGFGLPIIEAQSVGRVVVTSRRSPMSEVAGDAAVLVDPLSEESIRDGIERVIGDHELRESLIELGFTNAKRYNPAHTAEEYARLYRAIARGQSAAAPI
jgi:glycosyltransferase involved in cell wall biosynthesis